MTKYTDEEIIAYLKTLREGDVLTAAKTSDDFIVGRTYRVEADDEGDLFIYDDDKCEYYVFIYTVDYNCEVYDLIDEGVFEIPSPATAPFKVTLGQAVATPKIGEVLYRVTITADAEGLAKLHALEFESEKTESLAILYAKRTEIQADIDRLEAL